LLTLQALGRIAKPEYVFRPQQIGRRIWIETVPRKSELTKVWLPWGYPIAVNPTEVLGWAIYSRAICEVAVTEALWRLAQPGDIVVDGGANIGYATSILAARVGATGQIHSFEPDPRAFRELQENVKLWEERGQRGCFVLHNVALGPRSGAATLHVPESFGWNGGRARIETTPIEEPGSRLEVSLVTLDEVFQHGERVSVVKLDVEEFELDALMGMEQLLRERRVEHIVFEEKDDFPAPTHEYLKEAGYSVFGLDAHFLGIKCCRDKQPRTDPVYGPPPNYVATHQPEKTVRQLERGLWRSFGPASYLSSSS
jgi:FkbM family methyltransferase